MKPFTLLSRIFLLSIFIPSFLNATNSFSKIKLTHDLYEATYSENGVEFIPSGGEIIWNWQIQSIEGMDYPFSADICPVAEGNDILYQRGDITEKYLFRGNSIEQQFVISSKENITGNLFIEGKIISNGLFSEVDGGWVWNKNEKSVYLGNVFVYDANGQEIAALMSVSGEKTIIKIAYKELIKAEFPVTIDPQIGPDDFVLVNPSNASFPNHRIFQPKLIYNTTANNFVSVWSRYDTQTGYSLRKTQIEGGNFTLSQIRSQSFQADQTSSYATSNISTAGPSSASYYSSALVPDVAAVNGNNVTVWEDFLGPDYNNRRIMYRIPGVKDTTAIFKTTTFTTPHGYAEKPSVGGNSSRFLIASAAGRSKTNKVVVGKLFTNTTGIAATSDSLIIFTNTTDPYEYTDVDVKDDGNFIVVAATKNTIYSRVVNADGSMGTQFTLSNSNTGIVGSVSIAHGYLVWSNLNSAKPSVYGVAINTDGTFFGTGTQIDLAGEGSGFPSIAYSPLNSGSWLIAWHNSPIANLGTMIFARQRLSGGSFGAIFPVSKQTRTSVTPTVAYDEDNDEFWIAWSGGGSYDQLLAQRWTSSFNNCTISLVRDTLRENYVGSGKSRTTDIYVNSLIAKTVSNNEPIYPLNYFTATTDTFQTAYLSTLPIQTTDPPNSTLADFYEKRDKLFYIRDDSVNYEEKKRYYPIVYAYSEDIAVNSPNKSDTVRVIDVNELFTASFPTSLTFLEDQPAPNIPFTFQSGDMGKERNSIDLNVTVKPVTFVANPILKVDPSVQSGAHSDWPRPTVIAKDTLFFTLNPNANGTGTNLQFTLTDLKGGEWVSLQNDRTTNYSIPVTITPVNDAPSFTPGGDIVVNEDCGVQSSIWASAFSKGPSDENSQTLTLSVTNDHNSLFSSQPALNLAGTLAFTPAADSSGIATVRVRLKDTGGMLNNGVDSLIITFTITVNSVNDAPTFVAGSNQTKLEDGGSVSVEPWAISIDNGPTNESTQTLAFSVTNNMNSLFSTQPSIDVSGNLTYTLAANAFGVTNVRVRLGDGGGTANGGVDSSSIVNFTITVTAINDAPSFTKQGGDQTISEDAGVQSVLAWATNISAGNSFESLQTLQFAVSNNNPGLFSVPPAISSSTGNLTYTPAGNAFGVAIVRVRLGDNGGTTNGGIDSSLIETFTITIDSVNDAPDFTIGTDPDILEDAGAQTFSGWAYDLSSGPANENLQTLTFQVDNDNNGLFSIQPSIDEVTGDLIFTPVANAFGTVNLEIILSDNGGSSNGGINSYTQYATINVDQVNDAPSFTAGGDQTVLLGVGAQTVNNWATNISAGPANESGQSLSFVLGSDNPGLFSVQPAISSLTGTLTYTPASGVDGAANVRVRFGDNGGTSNGGVDSSIVVTLVITVVPVNSAPSFTAGGDVTVNEDAGVQSILWATNISKGPGYESGQTLTFILRNDNPSLFSQQPDLDETTGLLSFKSVDNDYGIAHLQVQLRDDGGIANGGVDSTAFVSFTITVNSSNDAPSFTKGADQSVLEDCGAQTVSGWATGMSTGPANESGQTLLFTLTNDNNTLFSSQPAINASGELTYTPAVNAYGASNVRIRFKDNGGILNSGGDTLISNFTITVTTINDRPVASNSSKSGLEDASLGFASADFNFSDLADITDVLDSIEITTVPANGAFTFNSVGVVAEQHIAASSLGNLFFLPGLNEFGSSYTTFSFKVCDNNSTSSSNGKQWSLSAYTFTININAVNDAPSFTKGADQTVLEDCGVQTVSTWATSISRGPANESGQTLLFTLTNDNSGLFSIQPSISSVGTLTYTPAANANGVSNVRVVLKDDGATANGGVDSSLIQTFIITVTDVNDAPSFTKGADQTVLEDCGIQSVTGWAGSISNGPSNESSQTLLFTLTNNNNSLFSSQPSIDASGTLTYTPVADASGVANIRVKLKDNGGILNSGVDTLIANFIVTVTSVNDKPIASSGSKSGLEDTALGFVAVDFNFSDLIETSDLLDSIEISTLPVLGTLTFNSVGVIAGKHIAASSLGNLSYLPALNDFGIGYTSFTFKVCDNNSSASSNGKQWSLNAYTFTIDIDAVNDAPSFTKGTDQSVLEDCGAQTAAAWATSIDKGAANESGQTLLFTVSNDNNSLFSTQPAVAANGTLTFTPVANANGVANVRVILKDDGATANGGVDSSLVKTFIITVTGVNDAPSFTVGSNQTVFEDCGAQIETNWATSISKGPANESLQTLSFELTNDNNTLFSTQPSIDASGALTYTPAVNANGFANIRVRLGDNGGTLNGGVDSSSVINFTITVTNVNDAPSFTAGANQTVLEDCGSQTVTAWATNISAGPSDEIGQTLSFSVSNDNNSLFSVQPAINASGVLTFTPATDANGLATLRVRLGDNGGNSNGGVDSSLVSNYTITVGSVNDAPSFTSGSNQTVLEDCGAQTVSAWATNMSKGPLNESGQALAFAVSNNNGSLFSIQPSINSANGNLTYTPASNAYGLATVRVRLGDNGGRTNSGVDSSGVVDFTITVQPVNDSPVAQNSLVTMLENETHTFISADFGFSDLADLTDVLDSVNIVSAPTKGRLILAGDTVTVFPLIIKVTQLSNLKFKPVINKYGNPYSSFPIKVGDNNNSSASNGKLWSSNQATLSIKVINTNQPPSDIQVSGGSVRENTYGDSAGKLTCTDPDPDDVHTYVITQNFHDLFEIVHDTLKLKNTNWINYEVYTQCQVQIKVTDPDGESFTETLIIPVVNMNDTPFTRDFIFGSRENKPFFLEPLLFYFTDEDAGDALKAIQIMRSETMLGDLYLSRRSGTAKPEIDQKVLYYPITIPVSDLGNYYFYASEGDCSLSQQVFQFKVADKQMKWSTGWNTAISNIRCANHAPLAHDQQVSILSNELFAFGGQTFGFYDPSDHSDRFGGIEIITLPDNGELMLDGFPVLSGHIVDADELDGLTYQPDPWKYGQNYDDFRFKVKDQKSSDPDWVPLFSSASYLYTINVTRLNYPPASQNREVNISEDEIYTFSSSDFPLTDSLDVTDALGAVQLIFDTNPFVLMLDGEIVVDGTLIPTESLSHLSFNYSPGKLKEPVYTFKFKVVDNNSISAPNGRQFSRNEYRFTINVLPINHPPTSENINVEIFEDNVFEFNNNQIVFEDIEEPGDEISALIIGFPSIGGTAFYKGNPIVHEQIVPFDSINEVSFKPRLNLFGNNAAQVPFRVVDNNSIGSPVGNAISQLYYLTLNLLPVNDPPFSFDEEVTVVENGWYHFNTASFNFTDAIEATDQLSSVLITSLSQVGLLKIDGVTLTIPSEVSVSDLVDLTYFAPDHLPLVNPSFTFKVKDNNSTAASNGMLISEHSYIFTFNIVDANSVPVAVDSSFVIDEDENFIFNKNIFGFTDADTEDQIDSVIIISLPGKGILYWNEIPVNVGFIFSSSESNQLSYLPELNEFGDDYASFGFRVKDDNSINAMNGAQWSLNSAQLTVNVVPVNDPPVMFNTTEDKLVDEFSLFGYSVKASDFYDADGDPLEIEIVVESGNWIYSTGADSIGGLALPLSDDRTTILIRVIDNQGGTAEYSFDVTIVRKQRPLIYGLITCTNPLPDSIPVALLEKNGQKIDSINISITGNRYYYFEGVDNGKYIIKAVNIDPVGYPDLISTYYVAEFDWKKANQIEVASNAEYETNIDMLTNPKVSGFGSISGNVYVMASSKNSGTISTGTGNTPLPYTDIFLTVKGESDVYLVTQTNLNGSYHFDNLPAGEYIVSASLPGFKLINSYYLIINSGTANHVNINFIAFLDDQVITENDLINKFDIVIFPNPTAGLLQFKTDSDFKNLQIRVIGINGRTQLEKEFHQGSALKMDIGTLPKAEYLIEVCKDNGAKVTRNIVLK